MPSGRPQNYTTLTDVTVPPEYFALTSGLERWLYRLARRHAGKQPAGWRFTMRQLHERSGSSQSLTDFARDLRKVIGRNRLPEYHVEIGKGQRGDELVVMVRDPARATLPQKRTLQRL
jgi:plasmid replication initiation protein